jgi:hypothetical protein
MFRRRVERGLRLPMAPARQSSVPFLTECSYIFRMNRFGPTPSANFFEWLPEKIQPSPIKIIQISIGPSSVNKRGSCINGTAECVFSRTRFIVLKGLTRLRTRSSLVTA